jgi:predicted acetyltransferase
VSIEIRHPEASEYPAVVETVSTAFLERPDIARTAAQLAGQWDAARTWIAVDGSVVAGTFRSWATEITVPGLAQLPAAAVAAVTVLPTHRRRGILTRMAAAEHAAVRERGEAMALLYASEYPIYGRFGYGSATRLATWVIDPLRTGIVAGEGTPVELVQATPALRDEVAALFDAWRRTQVSELRRPADTWDYRLGLEADAWDGPFVGWIAVHRGPDGAIDGLLRYRAETAWESHLPKNGLFVRELFAATEEAERALWAHLLTTDLVASVTARARSHADRIAYRLTNPRAAVVTEDLDALWVRLFDVPRALAARTYERAGSLVLEVVDGAAAGGRWRLALDGSPDGATCMPTDRSPDLTIPVAALGSVYLGAHDLRDVVLRLGADEHRSGALAEAATMFRTAREPWSSTFF